MNREAAVAQANRRRPLMVATGIAGMSSRHDDPVRQNLTLPQDLAVVHCRKCGRESTGTFLGEEHPHGAQNAEGSCPTGGLAPSLGPRATPPDQPQQTPRTEIHAGASKPGIFAKVAATTPA